MSPGGVFYRSDAGSLVPSGTQVYPLAGLAPAGLHLRDAEQAVALFADQLGTVPLEEVVRRTTYARGCCKRVEALLAALLLIAEGPAQADKREEDEEKDLKQVCGERQGRVDGLADICAQQKCEKQNERCFFGEEELALDPAEFPAGRALLDMSARGGCKGDEDYERRFEKGTFERIAEIEAERMPTAVQRERDQRGEEAETEKRGEAEDRGAGEGASPAIGAEPEGITGEADGEIGGDGQVLDATIADATIAAAMVHVPELGLPGAGPLFAFV